MALNTQTPPVKDKCCPHDEAGWRIDKTTKHWMLGNYDSGIVAEGKNGATPYIGTIGVEGNENWWINGQDTGVSAKGIPGDDGERGNGWMFVNSNTTTAPSGSIVGDIIMSTSEVNPITIGNTTGVLNGAFVRITSITPFEVTAVLGRIVGSKGDTGTGTQGPPGSHLEERFGVSTDPEVAPAIDVTQRFPVNYLTNQPTAVSGQYVWRTSASISPNNNLIGVWVNPQRVTGTGGSLYTWIKYADTPTTGMSDDPTGKEYIGISYNRPTQIESTDYNDYEWALIVGQGVPGPPGEDGQSLYTWVKYADDASGTGMSDDPTGKDYIGLSYNNITPTESTNPLDYTWALYKGDQGIQGPIGNTGPTVMLRFDYDPTATYYGSDKRVEFVKYNNNGYQTLPTAGEIPPGTLPTDTDYWEGPIPYDEAVFAEVLIAYNAYIENLTVGMLATGPEPNVVPDPSSQGERYTVGFMPTSEIDPTSNPNIFSRHGQRQYHPSGRIASYQGVILDDFEYETEDGLETVVGFAWIVFKDEENSPVHFVVDSTTAKGIQYVTVTPPRWDAEALSRYLDFGLVAEEDDPKDYYTITYGGTPYIRNDEMCGYFDPFNAPNYGYAGIKVDNTPIFRRTPASNEPIQTVRYVTSNGGNTPVNDGWYVRYMTIIQDGRQGDNANININMDAFKTEDGYITGVVPIEFLNQPFGDIIVPVDNVCPVYIERFELEP